jgi:hypothetical protein
MLILSAEALAVSEQSSVHSFVAGPEDRYPSLHEQQILENQRWHERRDARIEEHARRVSSHLRRYARGNHKPDITQGKRRATWCVELKQRFASLTAAGRFVGRPPSNILQAIYSRNRCGSYHWEYFDPARHLLDQTMCRCGQEAVVVDSMT